METESKAVKERIVKEKSLVIEQLRKTPVVQVVCERVGISRATYYRWLAKDKRFAQGVSASLSEGTELINDMAVSALISSISEKNLGAVKFWLVNKSKDFSPKLEINTNQTRADAKLLTKEQQDLIKKAVDLSAPLEVADEGS